jgi:putative PIG3 family NAD(P)H quinone oxidoreductase
VKAVRVLEAGGPEKLRVEEFADPEPGPGELVIDVHATALNRADLLQRRGLYPAPPGASEILGLECAGVVAKCGRGAERFALGTRVMALLAGGGYAERVVVNELLAIPIPATLSFEQAATIPEAFLTAREALFSAGRLQTGESVLIHAAAGGVGSAAVQLARVHGSRVFATASSADKLRVVRELGADVAINYREQDFVSVIENETQREGVNLILDFIGASYAEKHAACLAHGGRQVVLGLLGGASAKLNFSKLLMKRQHIIGVVMRTRPLHDKVAMTRAFVRDTLPLFELGKLRTLIDSVFSLSEVARAHERMESNANIGKIVLSIR